MVLHCHSHEMREYFRDEMRVVNVGGYIDTVNPTYFMIDAFNLILAQVFSN